MEKITRDKADKEAQRIIRECNIKADEIIREVKEYDENFPVQYVIQSKHGKDVRKHNEAEGEILFKRNSTFRVTNIDGNTIYMEEV